MRNFIVAGDNTHFRYNRETQSVECTHGGWSGTIKFNDDGSCCVDVGFKVINYDKYRFTHQKSIQDVMGAR